MSEYTHELYECQRLLKVSIYMLKTSRVSIHRGFCFLTNFELRSLKFPDTPDFLFWTKFSYYYWKLIRYNWKNLL